MLRRAVEDAQGRVEFAPAGERAQVRREALAWLAGDTARGWAEALGIDGGLDRFLARMDAESEARIAETAARVEVEQKRAGRRAEIARLFARGQTGADIAAAVGVSRSTVEHDLVFLRTTGLLGAG